VELTSKGAAPARLLLNGQKSPRWLRRRRDFSYYFTDLRAMSHPSAAEQRQKRALIQQVEIELSCPKQLVQLSESRPTAFMLRQLAGGSAHFVLGNSGLHKKSRAAAARESEQ